MTTIAAPSTVSRLPGDHAGYLVGHGAGEMAVAVARADDSIAVDIETRGLGRSSFDITAVAIGTSREAYVLHPVDDAAAIRDALASARTIVMHNSSFDVPPLVRAGLMNIDDVDKVVDTVILGRLAWPGHGTSKSLGALCESVLGAGYAVAKDSLSDAFKAVTGGKKDEMFARLTMTSAAFCAYASFDVIMTARLIEALPAAVASTLRDHPYPAGATADVDALIRREQDVNRLLLHRSARGIEVDLDECDRLRDHYRAEASRATDTLLELGLVGAHELSDHELTRTVVDALDADDVLGPRWPRLKDGRASASRDWLDRLDDPRATALRRRNQSHAAVSRYVDALLDRTVGDRIHPRVSVLVAKTGRMSYSDPPLQQWPDGMRRTMISDVPLVSLDWTSIEPAIAAALARDAAVSAPYEAGDDLYTPIAAAAGVTRPQAKTIVLATLYGQGARSLATRLGTDVDGARALISRVKSAMPGVSTWSTRVSGAASRFGVVPTVSGRMIPIEVDERFGGFQGYRGVNAVVQGSAYDVLADVLATLQRSGMADRVFAAVHDEIVVDAEVADEVEHLMSVPPERLVEAAGRAPVLRTGRVELGHRWEPKKESVA